MFKREFKINFKSLILWSSILMILFLIVFLVYPSIVNSEANQSINDMMKLFPEEVLKTFNMDISGIDSAYGWFKTEGLVFILLLGGLYAGILGSTILVKEESDKTIEFLYSKPISRKNIVTSKIMCGVINILIFTGLVTLFNLCGIMLSDVDDFDLKQYLLLSISSMFLYYMLFFICLFISTFLKKTRKSMSIGMGVVFVSYFLQIIGNMGESVEFIKYFSVYEFVSSRYIILNNSLDIKYVFIGLALIALSILGTYINYNKKELV